MFRQLLGALVLASMVGCSANSSFQPFSSSRSSDERSQMAAYAATAHYPSDMKPVTDIRAGALVTPRMDAIKIANFSDEPIRNSNVWVNSTFVYRAGIIPAHGSISVNNDEFYDGNGETMRKVNALPSRVELQAGDRLYGLGTAQLQ
jgi:hypothetical protein